MNRLSFINIALILGLTFSASAEEKAEAAATPSPTEASWADTAYEAGYSLLDLGVTLTGAPTVLDIAQNCFSHPLACFLTTAGAWETYRYGSSKILFAANFLDFATRGWLSTYSHFWPARQVARATTPAFPKKPQRRQFQPTKRTSAQTIKTPTAQTPTLVNTQAPAALTNPSPSFLKTIFANYAHIRAIGASWDVYKLLEELFWVAISKEKHRVSLYTHGALIYRYKALLSFLLSSAPEDVNAVDPARGQTLLDLSAVGDFADMVDFLFENYEVNMHNPSSSLSALHAAAVWGKVESAKALIKHGADVNDQLNRNQLTPLHAAVTSIRISDEEKLNWITFLLSEGANPNLQGADGATPLHYAARIDSEELITIFKKYNGDFSLKDNEGNTADDYLQMHINDKLGTILDATEATDSSDENTLTPIEAETLKKERPTASNVLKQSFNIDAEDNNGQTPLSVACLNEHPEVIKVLLEHGADPFHRIDDVFSPIKTVIKAQNPVTKEAFFSNIDVHAKASNGKTALMVAVEQGDLESTQLLLKRGADVNAKTDKTVLTIAASIDHPKKNELINMLLDAGANYLPTLLEIHHIENPLMKEEFLSIIEERDPLL